MSKDLSNEMYDFKHRLEFAKEIGVDKVDIDICVDKINQFAHRVSILEESPSND